MNFYMSIARKYANIRTFEPETGVGTGTGTGTGEGQSAAEAAAAEAEAAQKAAEAAQAASGTSQATSDVAAAQAELARLQAELAAANDEKARLLSESMSRKEKLKSYDGVDVEKYRKLVADEAAAAQAAAEAAGDFERVKKMMADAHEVEKAALEAEVRELNERLSQQGGDIDKLTMGSAFGNSAFIGDKMTLTPVQTRRIYGDHFEIQNGQVVAFDKPAGAKDRTMLVDARGEALPFDLALEKIVDADPDKKSVLRSRARSGAGSGTDAGAETKVKTEPQDNLYGRSRIAASLAAEATGKR